MRLRLVTFNVENLSARWRFGQTGRGDAAAALSLSEFARPEQREAVEHSLSITLEDDKRQMTGLALAEAHADLVCLQEVDSLRAMEAFFANYVHRFSDTPFGHFRLLNGNDPRGIDVAFGARKDLLAKDDVRVVSHREATFEELGVHSDDLARLGIPPDGRVFARDCLEVNLRIAGRPLTLFIVHLKSMENGKLNGREGTRPVRFAEALAVRRIIERRFGVDWRDQSWVVAGDLNDFVERIGPGGIAEPAPGHALSPLIDHAAVNPVAALPAHERWTHFHREWSGELGRMVEEHVQLDYVLLSPALARKGPSVEIIRRGLPYRVPLDPREPDRSIARLALTVDRYPRIGWDRPKASDHCPLVVSFELPDA
jgi:endonuclease/exonuclease/phosphatase family metal-dependent hydrolase